MERKPRELYGSGQDEGRINDLDVARDMAEAERRERSKISRHWILGPHIEGSPEDKKGRLARAEKAATRVEQDAIYEINEYNKNLPDEILADQLGKTMTIRDFKDGDPYIPHYTRGDLLSHGIEINPRSTCDWVAEGTIGDHVVFYIKDKNAYPKVRIDQNYLRGKVLDDFVNKFRIGFDILRHRQLLEQEKVVREIEPTVNPAGKKEPPISNEPAEEDNGLPVNW